MLSCEYCEIFKSNIFYRTPPVTASQQSCIYRLSVFQTDFYDLFNLNVTYFHILSSFEKMPTKSVV